MENLRWRVPRQKRRSEFFALKVVALLTIIGALFFVAWSASALIGILSESESVSWNLPHRRKMLPSIIHVTVTQETLKRVGDDVMPSIESAFCALWAVDVDDWWSMHPLWEIALQNSTHQCFRRIDSLSQRILYRDLSNIQFPTTCQHAVVKHMTGSGWGVDFSHAVDGLLWAIRDQVPVFCAAPNPWQYTAGVHGSAAHQACPTADLRCYFLPLTNCTQQETLVSKPEIRYKTPWRGFIPRNAASIDWTVPMMLLYATRPQRWLRERAVQMATTVDIPSQCTVLHVRRADVVLHGKFSRRYHAIAEYLQALEDQTVQPFEKRNILLLTDDANAVIEATTKHSSNYNWFYLDRPRHQGASGGWENHIPSDDPAQEVIVLHAEFELIRRCNTIVHSKSNLADYMYAVMMYHNYGSTIRIDLDANQPNQRIHSSSNKDTVRISTDYSN